jgi:MFS family permease
MIETEKRTPGDTTTMLAHLAAGGLTGRTFAGLLVAQFLAAFNDQALHAAAMFFAINTQALDERSAISLMPILFYAPWAIFCTVAGWLADKYSKRTALVTWKLAEVGIASLALVGFFLGRHGHPQLGPWVVLAAVFGMGTHSAFFVPAKYGIMPEILPPEKLSKGNGLLESFSFLAVILGTVSGGVLSFLYLGNEVVIGLILLALAAAGAAASFFIRRVPAANPTRRFPPAVYGPLIGDIRTLLRTPALRVALQGIAFFTFVVAFMRAAVYMLGESHNPKWDELKTSMVVGTVALGIGLGSPLAGWLSGKRIELRLVLIGAAGMIALLLTAAVFVDVVPGLVACIVGIGFFTGFYIVPLYTLLQYKAPKSSKGEMIATSNFVNVTGAIAASLLFFAVVFVAQRTGLAPEVTNRVQLGTGELRVLTFRRGRPVYFEMVRADGEVIAGGRQPTREEGSRSLEEIARYVFAARDPRDVLEVDRDVRAVGATIDVSRYKIGDVVHFDLMPAGVLPAPDYDNRHLPRFLFLGAAGLTGLILLSLWRPLLRLRRDGI